IAWHQGQLFGWVNQLIGVLTAVGLVTLATSGFVLWRRRKPGSRLGAPRMEGKLPARGPVVAILLVFAALLPMLAISLISIYLLERLLLPHMPRFADWLGVPVPTRHTPASAGVMRP